MVDATELASGTWSKMHMMTLNADAEKDKDEMLRRHPQMPNVEEAAHAGGFGESSNRCGCPNICER